MYVRRVSVYSVRLWVGEGDEREERERGGGGEMERGGMRSRHVTAMYDTAWSDGFQEILFEVNIIHVNSVR